MHYTCVYSVVKLLCVLSHRLEQGIIVLKYNQGKLIFYRLNKSMRILMLLHSRKKYFLNFSFNDAANF
jgi:hypothetical protein